RGTDHGLEVTCQAGWKGFSLHHQPGFESFDEIEIETNAAMKLSLVVVDHEEKTYEFPFTGSGKMQVYKFKVEDFSTRPPSLERITLQSMSPDPSEKFLVKNVLLRKGGEVFSALATEKDSLETAFQEAFDWALEHGRPLYLGEFGSFEKAELQSRVRWTSAVRKTCEERHIPWAYWGFGAGFGIYDPDRDEFKTELLKALVP
ncbi:MAG: cellulase family glycosylhydrolase, partial [Planctomycetota bacterium]